MGKDRDPWQFGRFNCDTNVGLSAFAKQNNNSMMMFPNYADPYGYYHLNSATMPCPNPIGFTSGQKNFMVFDQTGNKRNLVFSSLSTQFPYTKPTTNFGSGLDAPPQSKEANVSNGNKNEEEMHEDTEEIDALLYSDSDDNDDDYEEEEASTGHSPLGTATDNIDNGDEEVVSSTVLQTPQPPPAKRRRTESGFDPSLADTASSTDCYDVAKKAKRERIQETVGVLRRIIPGGNGKDAATVIDEAIRYLKSLRLKAKGLGFPAL